MMRSSTCVAVSLCSTCSFWLTYSLFNSRLTTTVVSVERTTPQPSANCTQQESVFVPLPLWQDELTIHTYHEGTIAPGYEVLFDSYLVTQSLESSRFIQWMREDWASSEDPSKRWLVQRYSATPNIEFRLLNHRALASGTCFEHREEFLERTAVAKHGIKDWSNVVRLLLLYNFGGVWVDSDSLILLDLSTVHNVNRDSFVSEFVADRDDPDMKDIETGIYNNQFLYATSKVARQKIIQVACEFRRRPAGVDEKGVAKFENVSPLIGEDKHPLKFKNGWMYNDGVSRRCRQRADCPLKTIGIGMMDPTWYRTAELLSFCEKLKETYWQYTAKFDDLLFMKAWVNSTDYIGSADWTKHVWTIHTRNGSCRSRTGPAGTLNFFENAISERMFGDPKSAPRGPVDFISFDRFEVQLGDHFVESHDLIIAVRSGPNDFERRQLLRAMLSSNAEWFQSALPDISVKHKLLFIVPYGQNDNKGSSVLNSRLLFESKLRGDLILVDPLRNNSDEKTRNQILHPEVRRGLLKLLNVFEGNNFLLLLDDRVFVHLPNLYRLIHTANGRSTHAKLTPLAPFVITHNSGNSAAEAELRRQYNGTTFGLERQSKFVLFSRSNLPVLLGLPDVYGSGSGAGGFLMPEKTELLPPLVDQDSTGNVYRYTSPVTTARAAATRLPRNSSGPVATVVGQGVGRGVLAKTPDNFGFQTLREEEVLSEAELALMKNYGATNCGRNRSRRAEAAPLPPNLVFIFDVPCPTAMRVLQSAVSALPRIDVNNWLGK